MILSAAAALLTAAALFVSCGCASVGSFIESFYYTDTEASEPVYAGENAAASEPVQAFSEPTPSPSPEPEPDLTDEFSALVEKEFFGLVSFDIGFEPDVSVPFAEDIGAHKAELLVLEEAYRASAEEALPIAVGRAAHEFDIDVQSERLEGDMPSWQLAVALSWACGRDRGDALLRSHSSLDITVNDGELTARLVPAEFDAAVSGARAEERFTADFIYSYYLTVYDDSFEEAEYVMPSLSQKYVSSLCYPLDDMYFYDSWYGPREYSTRYHLGMDIHAWRDSKIYSCSDGTVTMLGLLSHDQVFRFPFRRR